MGLKDELVDEVGTIFKSKWDQRDGYVVPADSSVKLSNDGVNLNGAVLYADMSDSTKLVESNLNYVAAEIYKAFLRCAAKIIIAEGGVITAYDGDRVMAVFVGAEKETQAVRAALKLHWAVDNIVNKEFKGVYTQSQQVLKHVVGIDTSPLFIARTGIRGANDLVWVGRAANYAAKLTSLPHAYQTYITSAVYAAIGTSAKYSRDGVDMWQARIWNNFNNSTIYCSAYWWELI